MMKRWVIIGLILCSASLLQAEYIHGIVVDSEGRPIEGAKTVIEWRRWEQGWWRDHHYPRGAVTTTGKDGRFRISVTENDSGFLVKPTEKEGYKYEEYLNPMRDEILDFREHTRDNPYRIVLRKVLDEKAYLLLLSAERRLVVKPEDKAGRLDIDLFGRFLEPEVHGDRRTPHVDFSVLASFDAQARRWSIVFKTDNDDTGIIATTNRVFLAPESGYSNRVEVPQEMYTNECFSLYLYTRKPRMYVMFDFDRDDLHARTDNYAHFKFSYNYAKVNPYGSRVFEPYDESPYRELLRGFFSRSCKCLLEEHRYPPRLDIPARLENRRQWQELADESTRQSKLCQKLEEEKKTIERQLNEGIKVKGDRNVVQIDMKIGEAVKAMRRCMFEQRRLDKEIGDLFLPDAREDKVKK